MSEQVTVIARVRAKHGMEHRVREELSRLIKPTRAEAGCINYDLHDSPSDPQLFLFHENWQSLAHLDAHRHSPHLLHWRDVSADLLETPPDVTLWRILP